MFGDGVNIASRLQSLAEPDTICISDMVYRDVAQKLDLGTVVSLGRPKLKNIAVAISVYALLSAPPKGLRQTLRVQRLKLSRRVGTCPPGGRRACVVRHIVSRRYVLLRLSAQYLSPPPSLPLPDKPSIVVLPFVNMSDDPEQDYFSDGITEDITSDLSRFPAFSSSLVTRRSRTRAKPTKVQDVSREMGVRYVWKAACESQGSRCASLHNWSTPQPAGMCGPSGMIGPERHFCPAG